jgi:hypothetical protein
MLFSFWHIAFADLNDGLVAYYSFNGNAYDASQNGNHAQPLGEMSYGDGIFGKAPSFEGVDTGLIVSDNDTLDLFNAMTITAWIQPVKIGGVPLVIAANK